MIPKKHAQRLLGISAGIIIMVGLMTYFYLGYLGEQSNGSGSTTGEAGKVETINSDSPDSVEPLQGKMYALFRQDAYYFGIKDAKLYLDSYYNYPLLFSGGLEFERSLNRGRISEKLRQLFGQHRIRLSDNATVTVEQYGAQWLITDRKGNIPWALRFTVVKEEDQLNVYRNPQDFSDHQLQVDFATLYPQQYAPDETDWSVMPWEELRSMYNEYATTRSSKFEVYRFRLIDRNRLPR